MPEFVKHPLIKPHSIERREYQEALAKKALTGNTLVVMPTALGKTMVAALAIAEVLEEDKDNKVLIMAPTKPLVNQHYETLKNVLNLDDDAFVVLTGEVPREKRKNMFLDARIISATPQTIRNELRRKRLNLENVRLLVVDESHRSVSRYSYVDVAKYYLKQARKPLILGLTASPSSKKVQEICDNLCIQNIEIREEEDADVKPYIQEKDVKRVYVKLPKEFEEIKSLLKMYYDFAFQKLKDMRIIHGSYIKRGDLIKLHKQLIARKIFPAIPHATALIKLEHAIGLLETQGIFALEKYFNKLRKDGTRTSKMMMKNSNISKAMELSGKLYKEKKEHPKLDILKNIVENEFKENPNTKIIVFSNYRDSARKIVDELESLEKVRVVRFIGQASKGKDIGLSQDEQAEILNKFRNGGYNIIVCTSVGEEGLDIPSVDSVIFYEPVPSEIRKIQREGRTGRRRAGKVIILITKGTRDESYYWMAVRKEKKMHEVLEKMKKDKTRVHQKKLDMFLE